MSKLLGYDYVITYKKGKEHLAADALSRVYESEEEVNDVTVIKPQWKEELHESYQGDDLALDILTAINIQGGGY